MASRSSPRGQVLLSGNQVVLGDLKKTNQTRLYQA
jgi:hypothetical protein